LFCQFLLRLSFELNAVSIEKAKGILIRSYKTLQMLSVGNLMVGPGTPYGIPELGMCTELKDLYIPNHSTAAFILGRGRSQPYQTAVYEQYYPDSITTMDLDGCHIPKTMLVNTLLTLHQLECLKLSRVGAHWDFGCGVEFSILHRIVVELSQLKTLVIFGVSHSEEGTYTLDVEIWTQIIQAASNRGSCQEQVLSESETGKSFLSGGKLVFNFSNLVRRQQFVEDIQNF